MAERLLVTQALDERDLLAKKIEDKIEKLPAMDVRKKKEEKTARYRLSPEEFAKMASSAYQQVLDLISRYRRLDAALVTSNAKTLIHTSYGDFTVAAAIALRGRIKGDGMYGGEAQFEEALIETLQEQLQKCMNTQEENNRALKRQADSMRESILGSTASKEEAPLDVTQAFLRENNTEIIDPLEVQKTVDELREKIDTLLKELDTQIKVSNATTYIEF